MGKNHPNWSLIRLFTVLLMLAFNTVFAQQRQVRYVGGSPVIKTVYFSANEIQGVIFPKDYKLVQDIIPEKMEVERFTPTVKTVLYVDSLAFDYVKEQNEKSEKDNGGYQQQGTDGCPIIYENWSNYIRQVIGYISPVGDEMILINCFWKEYSKGVHYYWLEEFALVKGGCSYYWFILYNKTEDKIEAWIIN